jgi:hypothetical protein
MKNFNRRAISAALLITLGFAFSVKASAAETMNIENSISEIIVEQGQKVMSELSVKLQASIQEEVNNFSADFSLEESITESFAWLTEEESVVTTQKVINVIQPEKNVTTNIKLLK